MVMKTGTTNINDLNREEQIITTMIRSLIEELRKSGWRVAVSTITPDNKGYCMMDVKDTYDVFKLITTQLNAFNGLMVRENIKFPMLTRWLEEIDKIHDQDNVFVKELKAQEDDTKSDEQAGDA